MLSKMPCIWGMARLVYSTYLYRLLYRKVLMFIRVPTVVPMYCTTAGGEQPAGMEGPLTLGL